MPKAVVTVARTLPVSPPSSSRSWKVSSVWTSISSPSTTRRDRVSVVIAVTERQGPSRPVSVVTL